MSEISSLSQRVFYYLNLSDSWHFFTVSKFSYLSKCYFRCYFHLSVVHSNVLGATKISFIWINFNICSDKWTVTVENVIQSRNGRWFFCAEVNASEVWTIVAHTMILAQYRILATRYETSTQYFNTQGETEITWSKAFLRFEYQVCRSETF